MAKEVAWKEIGIGVERVTVIIGRRLVFIDLLLISFHVKTL